MGVGGRRAEDAVGMGNRRTFNAGEAIGGLRMRRGRRVIELKARGAKGGGVEAEHAGGAETTVNAS